MHSRNDAKLRGTKLREILNDLGHTISHANALEAIARQHGYKDWNVCSAALDQRSNLLPIPTGWTVSGDQRDDYDVGIDPTKRYNNRHPAIIRYRDTSPHDGLGFATLMQSFEADAYKGKRVELSAMLSCEDCSGAATLWMRADTERQQSAAFDNLEDKGIGNANGPIEGTTAWSQRRIVLDIPLATQRIAFGFFVRGRGVGFATDFRFSEVADSVEVTAKNPEVFTRPRNLTLETQD